MDSSLLVFGSLFANINTVFFCVEVNTAHSWELNENTQYIHHSRLRNYRVLSCLIIPCPTLSYVCFTGVIVHKNDHQNKIVSSGNTCTTTCNLSRFEQKTNNGVYLDLTK